MESLEGGVEETTLRRFDSVDAPEAADHNPLDPSLPGPFLVRGQIVPSLRRLRRSSRPGSPAEQNPAATVQLWTSAMPPPSSCPSKYVRLRSKSSSTRSYGPSRRPGTNPTRLIPARPESTLLYPASIILNRERRFQEGLLRKSGRCSDLKDLSIFSPPVAHVQEGRRCLASLACTWPAS